MNEQARIINCHQAPGQCPEVWGSLCQTGDRMIRQCMTCMHTVYYTESRGDAECRAAMGQCVAMAESIPPGLENGSASQSSRHL